MFVAKCYLQLKESRLKNNSTRNESNLREALKHVEQAKEIYRGIYKDMDRANYYVAKLLMAFADVYLELKKDEEAERYMH